EPRQGMPQPGHLFSTAPPRAKGFIFYYENVDVRFGAGIASGMGAEEHYLPRLCGLDDGSRHFFKKCVGNLHHSTQCTFFPRFLQEIAPMARSFPLPERSARAQS